MEGSTGNGGGGSSRLDGSGMRCPAAVAAAAVLYSTDVVGLKKELTFVTFHSTAQHFYTLSHRRTGGLNVADVSDRQVVSCRGRQAGRKEGR